MKIGQTGTKALLDWLERKDILELRLISRQFNQKIDYVLAIRYLGRGLDQRVSLLRQLGPSVQLPNQDDFQQLIPCFSQFKRGLQEDLPLPLHPVLEIIGVLCFPEDINHSGRIKLGRVKKILKQFRVKVKQNFESKREVSNLPASVINFFRLWKRQKVGAIVNVVRIWSGLWNQNRMREVGLMPYQLFRWVNNSIRLYLWTISQFPQVERQAQVCDRLIRHQKEFGLEAISYNRVNNQLMTCNEY